MFCHSDSSQKPPDNAGVKNFQIVKYNNKYRLCGARDETISHIISKCSKLTEKEYETKYV